MPKQTDTFRRARVAIARLSLVDRLAILFRGWAIVYLGNAKAHTTVHVAGRLPSVRSERDAVRDALAVLRKGAKDAAASNAARERGLVGAEDGAMPAEGETRDATRGGDRGEGPVGNETDFRERLPLSRVPEVARRTRPSGRDRTRPGTVGTPAKVK